MKTRRALVSSVAAAGLIAGIGVGTGFAQPPKKQARIGFLNSSNLATTGHWIQALRDGLGERGWVEGKNLSLDLRFAEGDANRNAPLLNELLARKPDVLVVGTDIVAKSALAITRALPVVFILGFDPVGLQVVESLARPGGNVTGLSILVYELTPKRFSLMRETLPRLARMGVLHNPGNPDADKALAGLTDLARASGVSIAPGPVGKPEDAAQAFAELARARAEAVLMIPDPVYTRFRGQLANLAMKYRLPTMFGNQEYVEAGALMSYAADLRAAYRHAAGHVDRILKGASPADLPVEQMNVYEFVVNLKTARSIGVSLPQTVLLQATKVIE